MDTSAKAGSVEKDRSVHEVVRWDPAGSTTNAVSATQKLPQFACGNKEFLPHKRDDPRQGGRRRRSSCISPGGSG